MPLPPWPTIDQNQIEVANSVLTSGKLNYWTGEHGKSFESEFASWSGSKYAIAHANGTLALNSAYLSLGITSGDEVITTPRSFVATSSSIALLGASPVFADVDLDSGCITAESIEPHITSRTKAISVVHLAGWPADMNAICQLANSYGLYVIEDCAQAHGATINNQSVGSFGDVAAWSFCQDKILSTAGEGGMVTTSSTDIFEFIWSFKDHGKNRLLYESDTAGLGFRWLHDSFGTNYRLTELQSAIGRIQLKLLPDWSCARSINASIMHNALSNLSVVRCPVPPDSMKHAWYKFYAYIIPDALSSSWSRDRILSEIANLGYPALTGSCSEIYLESSFRSASLSPSNRLPNAQALGETSLMFLVHPTITPDIMHEYSSSIRDILIRSAR